MIYIYCITNLVNGKTYFGKHKVKKGRTITSDTYWGSGKIIKAVQKKYGLENFKKEILLEGEFSKEEINRFERCIIACQRICGKAEYNIANGGEGMDSEMAKLCQKKSVVSENWLNAMKNRPKEVREKQSLSLKEKYKNGELSQKGKKNNNYGHRGYKLPEDCHKGEKNSQYGTHWYTDGEKNVKAKECPPGFRPGRI